MPDDTDKNWICLDLPVVNYAQALNLQRGFVAARKDEHIRSDIVLLLEHPSVFTLGRRGGIENLKVSRSFLETSNIPIVQVERGGSITFHGPGQLVVYPIIDLKKAGLDVLTYVERLEDVMIRVAADWQIKAEPNSLNRGIWVGQNKLGSIGISVQRGVCFHGFALNVNISLKPFDWILPCGLKDVGVTSMAREFSNQLSMNQVRAAVKGHIEAVFGVNLVMASLPEIQASLFDSIEKKAAIRGCNGAGPRTQSTWR